MSSTVALVRDAEKVQSATGKLMYGQYFDGAEIGMFLSLYSVFFNLFISTYCDN